MGKWILTVLAVLVTAVWIYYVNNDSLPLVDAVGRPATRSVDIADPPPNVPALNGFDVEVCGWVDDPAALDCFETAVDAGRGAEVYARHGTIEGDVVYTIYRSDPEGGVIEFVDASQDQFAGVEWYHWVCGRVSVEADALVVGGCQGEAATEGWDLPRQ